MTDNDPNEADDETGPMPTGPERESGLPVNKITWAQVGLVTELGRYMYKFGWLTVAAEDIGVWKQFPSAAFTLYSMGAPTPARDQTDEQAAEEFRLGTFELRGVSLAQ
jgi:hypothetical protein